MNTPLIIETVGRNKKTFDIATKLYDQNIIMLTGEIYDEVAESIISQLLYLDTLEDEDDIKIYINSPGGVVTAGLAIYDTIKNMRRKVQTVGLGSVASMAAILLFSGTGERKVLKNTRIMIHSIVSGTSGTVHDQIIDLEETKYLQNKMMDILSSTSDLDIETVKDLTMRNKYLSGEEAKTYGLIDTII